MSAEKVFSEKIVDGKIFKRNPCATHISVEGDDFVQYACNPKPHSGMRDVSPDVTEFVSREKNVNGHVFSYVIEAIGGEIPTTYHYKN